MGIKHFTTPIFTIDDLLSIAFQTLKHYRLDPHGIHGISHWGRVLENGTRLAELTGANIRVVQLFALFHDCRRINDDTDPDHGVRGASLAGEVNGKLFTFSPEELALLQDACTRHTRGFTEADITVQTCWDADRLDLPRVGKQPVPERLCTASARDIAFMDWTRERSIANHLTSFALELRNRIT
jgi:uncharacterized protein